MGEDEVGTLRALKAIRSGIVEPAVAEHDGRIIGHIVGPQQFVQPRCRRRRCPNERCRAGLVVNQPLRVTDADARLLLATGRTRDGEVLKKEFVADLAPDGRELDLEVFYEAPLGEQSTFGASAMLRTEPGHVRDAKNEGVFMFKFNHKF